MQDAADLQVNVAWRDLGTPRVRLISLEISMYDIILQTENRAVNGVCRQRLLTAARRNLCIQYAVLCQAEWSPVCRVWDALLLAAYFNMHFSFSYEMFSNFIMATLVCVVLDILFMAMP